MRPSAVPIVDEGGEFEVPVETLWAFLPSPDDHRESHSGPMKQPAKALTETGEQVSWDQDTAGRPVQVVDRIAMVPPVGFAVEQTEGPLAGSRFFDSYTPKGAKTGVTIVGEYHPPTGMSGARFVAMVRQNFASAFSQVTAAMPEFHAKR